MDKKGASLWSARGRGTGRAATGPDDTALAGRFDVRTSDRPAKAVSARCSATAIQKLALRSRRPVWKVLAGSLSFGQQANEFNAAQPCMDEQIPARMRSLMLMSRHGTLQVVLAFATMSLMFSQGFAAEAPKFYDQVIAVDGGSITVFRGASKEAKYK